jgi:hypothetical protein
MDSTETLPTIAPITMTQRLRDAWRKHALLQSVVWVCLSLLLFGVWMRQFWPHLDAWAMTQGQPVATEMPWVFKGTSDDGLLRVKLHQGLFTPAVWQIIPEDDLRALSINGQPVSLAQIPVSKLRDYDHGLYMELGQYLQRGDNLLEFHIANHGGDGGLQLRPVLNNLCWFILGASFLPLLWGLAQLFQLRPMQTILIALSLILICSYWNITPWQVRTYDVMTEGGHLDYVRYIATQLAIPTPTSGWTYYHPPLYYLLGAMAWRFAEWLGSSAPETVQALSLALWLIFLTSSAGALQRLIKSPLALMSATLLLVTWPSGILHSIRIGNDLGVYAASGVATWFLVRWWQSKHRRDAMGSVIGMASACALAMLCKSSALALVGACGMLLLLHWLRRPSLRRLHCVLVFSAISGAGLALSFAVRVYYYLHGLLPNWLVGNSNTLSSGLLVPNDHHAYLPVDLLTFLKSPWVSTWHDDTGRGNFWNFLLRSSLSGEFEIPGAWSRQLALIMGAVLLALLAVSLMRALFNMKLTSLWRHLPMPVLAAFWLASLLALRMQFPYSCSNDFRYILPIIVPLIVWWSRSGKLSNVLMVGMSLLSTALFLAM